MVEKSNSSISNINKLYMITSLSPITKETGLQLQCRQFWGARGQNINFLIIQNIPILKRYISDTQDFCQGLCILCMSSLDYQYLDGTGVQIYFISNHSIAMCSKHYLYLCVFKTYLSWHFVSAMTFIYQYSTFTVHA